MGTTIRLEHLLPHGQPDEPGYSFDISKESYNELAILPEDQFLKGNWHISECNFHEVCRRDEKSYLGIRLWKDGDYANIPYANDPQKYWHIVWIKEENVWIVFELYESATLNDTFYSKVYVSLPIRGQIFRPNEHVKSLIKQHFGVTI